MPRVRWFWFPVVWRSILGVQIGGVFIGFVRSAREPIARPDTET